MEGAFTVVEALTACGVNNEALFLEQTQAQRIASDIFDNAFASCMDVTFKELDEHFKTYFDLTAAQGQIRLNPGIRKNIKAFVQWTRDEIRLGREPGDTAFPIDQITDLIRRYHTHEKYKTDSRTLAEAAKPEKFKEATKWEDWKPTFLNYLRSIPGRDGVPLKYICRDNDEPVLETNDDFLDDYVAMASLSGDSFAIDTVQVHTFLVNFVAGNDTAEAKIQGLRRPNDGREAFKRLVEHYEGVGIHAIDIREADEVIKNLFYAGEKPPHMWWAEFEKRLTRAFNAYVKREGRIVHSNSMKIRMLIDKIKADFLTPTKAQMEIELSRVPMTMTYEQALSLFRNMVNQKHPPQMGVAQNRVRRNINETNTGRGARGQTGRGGYGRGGRGGRGSTRSGRVNVQRTRNDSRIITLTDGSQVEYHASFSFPRHVFMKFRPEDKETLRRERAAYNEQRRNRAELQELRTQASDVPVQVLLPVDNASVSQRSQVSQVTTGVSVMGGRNEQAQNRQNRRIAAVTTTRHVKSSTQLIRSTFGDPPANLTANNECDTNADTCCLGTNFVVLQSTYRTADVYAYDSSIKPVENVPIVTGATAYDDPVSGDTFILVFNESLYYGTSLDHSLINPNQVRSYGIPFWDNPYDDERGLGIAVDDDLSIPLQTMGTKIYFRTRVPTAHELERYEHIQMTSSRSWDPSQVKMLQETNQGGNTMFKWIGPSSPVDPPFLSKPEYLDATSDDALLHSIDPSLAHFGQLSSTRLRQLSEVDTVYEQEDIPSRRTFVSTERHVKVSAELLADRFGIGPKRAQRTLRVTTQRGVRSAILPIGRRYRADRVFGVKRLTGKFATDTAYGKFKSLRGNVGCQIYSHKCGFKVAYPMMKVDGNHVGDTLTQFIGDFGVPAQLTFDGASVQSGPKTRFMDAIRRYEIKYHVSGPRRPNENPAEKSIHEIKKRWYRIMLKKKVPPRLWDYGFVWVCETENLCASFSKYAEGRTPLEIITGETPDISEYLDFEFYDWVTFRSNAGLGEVQLGRWLGVSHRVGRLMSYWILPSSAIPISATTVQRLTNDERCTDEMKRRMNEYEDKVKSTFETQSADVTNTLRNVESGRIIDHENEDEEFFAEFARVIDDATLPHADDKVDDTTIRAIEVESDQYLGMELALPRGDDGTMIHARVTKRLRDDEGNPVGMASANPLLDSRAYEVEFADGNVEELTANIIAENLIAQVDKEGHRQMMLEEIIDHRTTPEAIPMGQGTYVNQYGVRRQKQTTRGWELLIQWKDGSTDWVALKDFKESYPVELALYAVDRGISDEPAFAWWVSYVLKKQKRILQKVKAKSKYWARTHKYGIRVPKNIKEALEIDKENGNTLWMDAVRLEMSNVRVAFEEFDGDPNALVGYTQITGHLVFDVKLGENFRRKARYCADGHKTGAPASVTYSTVVSRDSVRILLTIAALNGLDVLGADVQNAFLTAPNKEKCWMVAGPEFGPDEGKTFLVVKALYGLKSASFSFRAFMAEKLVELGFQSSLADPDVWLRAATKHDGEQYYEYVLMYVDDILAISCEAEAILKDVQTTFKFKNDKIELPEFYLGAKLQEKPINNIKCWTVSSHDYVKAAIKNVQEAIKNTSRKLPTKHVEAPMSASYVPELDVTEELSEEDTTFYQELIGVLRWATEIGRVDILLEVSLLSQYQANPREGHLEQLLHIFGYLNRHAKVTLYLSPELPLIEYGEFRTRKEDFSEIYRDAEEAMPHRMPIPRGRSVTTTAYVDASHGANKVTRRSHTGYVLFLNRAPIVWYSKKQQTVETSAFSAEFIAMKACLEAIEHLRFKLRCFGIPMPKGEPTYVFCDNESVVKNTSNVESTLNKKHSSVAYHFCRWSAAAGIISVAHIGTDYNLADCFTKRLPVAKRDFLFGAWTY